MNLIGQPVKHGVFGTGIVKDLSESIVTICFDGGEKNFIYPDAFNQFLTLADKKVQQRIQQLLIDREIELQKKKKEVLAAQGRKQKLSNFKIVKNSHAVFNIAPNQMAQLDKMHNFSTGTYCSGYSQGLSRIADRIKPNSACLLTGLLRGRSEQERVILGVFMAREDFFGEDAHNGIIETHPQYRILLPQENRLPFWKYLDQNAPTRWGNTAYKYCSGSVIHQILADIVELSDSDAQKEAAINLYSYFCKMNLLRLLIAPQGRGPEETK